MLGDCDFRGDHMTDPIEQFRQSIASAGLNPPESIKLGELHRFSSNDRKADTSGWCRIFLDGRTGVFGDFRRGFSCVWTAHDDKPPTLAQRQQRAAELQIAKTEAAAVQKIQWANAAIRNSNLLAQTLTIKSGDPVTCYLEARGLNLETWPQTLRYHPNLDYWHEGQCIGRFPAMIGAITDPLGQMVSLHRTYLTQDGSKAKVEIVKKFTAASASLSGCSVKLFNPIMLNGVNHIAVAEGIETALACYTASATPTVSAVSAHGLERYQWPESVQSLIIFTDNDLSLVGQRAGNALAKRAQSNGLLVRVLTPPEVGTDWADVWALQTEEF